jgi:hypothetical protein
MFSTLITAALFVSLAIQRASASFAINTPNPQGSSMNISWAPATPPYTIEIVPADDPCGEALETIPGLTTTKMTYTSKLASGTRVVLYIFDNATNDAWSGQITIGANSNCTSCAASTPSGVDTPVVISSPTIATPSPSSSLASLGGAINNAAGAPTNGALSVRQASTPVLSIMVLAAMLALTL